MSYYRRQQQRRRRGGGAGGGSPPLRRSTKVENTYTFYKRQISIKSKNVTESHSENMTLFQLVLAQNKYRIGSLFWDSQLLAAMQNMPCCSVSLFSGSGSALFSMALLQVLVYSKFSLCVHWEVSDVTVSAEAGCGM